MTKETKASTSKRPGPAKQSKLRGKNASAVLCSLCGKADSRAYRRAVTTVPILINTKLYHVCRSHDTRRAIRELIAEDFPACEVGTYRIERGPRHMWVVEAGEIRLL